MGGKNFGKIEVCEDLGIFEVVLTGFDINKVGIKNIDKLVFNESASECKVLRLCLIELCEGFILFGDFFNSPQCKQR